MADSKAIRQILTTWAREEVIPAAQRNIGATQTVMERNARGVKARKRRRVATGALKSSLTFFIKKGGDWKLVFTAKGSAAQYAPVIEWGRKPGSKPPPTYAIRQWMDEKRVRLQNESGGFIKETPGQRDRVAYLIARKIGKFGFPGIHYMRDAIEDKAPLLVEEYRKYLGGTFDNLND
jgi:hypothetical protein